jgi:predicted DNA binding CopG/RHH family protein
MKKLSREEQQLLAAFESGALKSAITSAVALRRYQEYARATLGKQQRVNIRLSAQTLAGIRSRAAEEGMPYQTLMATVLHKYTTGRFVEKRAVRSARASRAPRKRVAA